MKDTHLVLIIHTLEVYEVKQPAMFPAVYLIRRKLAFSLRPLIAAGRAVYLL
ncbi:hypothetical protein SD77_2543 [Bacillus badius]|uniref:Uncharacterized protein n=1 Tax=Bacillus badius TaxID=1455 RepID=A0ABR5AZD2_BACBA|nr:hypothetical protein SD77_2543 [Bacillus badius]